MTLKQLPISKTLLIRFEGGGDSNLFIQLFIAHSQGLKKFIFLLFQEVDVSKEG